jgi:hypothetical protein
MTGVPARRLLSLLVAGTCAATALRAAEFTVETPFDAVDDEPGDGFCATSGEFPVCTLRAAIMEANALPGSDTIELPAGTYFVSLPGPFEDGGASGDLDIHGALTIAGAGRDVTIIDATDLGDRVFEVVTPVLVAFGGQPVLLSGLTITGGVSSAADIFGSVPGGGGIRNTGYLTLADCRLSDNASNSFTEGGGGIANLGTLIVDGCEVQFNSADDSVFGGGGLLNFGAATLFDSSFGENSALDVGSGGGGGMANLGTLVATHCDVSGNSAVDAARGGGGIYHGGDELRFLDGTISGNDAGVGSEGCNGNAGGGGLSLTADFVFISGTTIDGNTAAADCEGQPTGGGGVHASDSDYLYFVNTTISGNETAGALQGGGGLLCSTCFAELFNCTVTGNRAVELSEFDSSQFGGGLSVVDDGEIAYENTIVLGNLHETAAAVVVAEDCAASAVLELTSNGHNLLGSGSGCAADGPGDGIAAGTAGVLGPLADNGGTTRTHALVPGSSPAIDAGDPAGCTFDDWVAAGQPLSTDQRGVARPADGDLDAVPFCDIGAYELAPATPPDCSRLILLGGPTDEIVGVATDDTTAADTGIFAVELLEASGIALVPPDFAPGDPSVTFLVQCVDPTPGDDSCEGTGIVQATDGEGLTCTLGIDFSAVPAGPLGGFPICQGDGTLLLIDNPLAGSGDPPNPAGTGACSVGELNEELPPLPPGRGPVEECDVFVVDSPVAGLTSMVYKVEINNLNLRLLFSEFDEGAASFLPWEDITLTVELIPQVIPDPTRMQGSRQWSPVMITCAELIAVDCSDPLNIDVDRDGDGVSPCPSAPGQPVDCDDAIGFVFPGALELCNGIDDDCDGGIDEGLDADADTVADCFDNCPNLANPPELCDPVLPLFQCDSDGDGLGDACDPPADDEDGDEDPDARDDERLDADPIQALHAGDDGDLGDDGPPATMHGADAPAAPEARRERATPRRRPERGGGR